MDLGEIEFICNLPFLEKLVILLELKVKLPLLLLLLILILKNACFQVGSPKVGVCRLQILDSLSNVSPILHGLSDMIDNELSGLVEIMGLLGCWDIIAAILNGFLGV